MGRASPLGVGLLGPWCVLDTETTGLGPDRELVEVALVDEAGRLVFESLVRPTRPPGGAASRVHGLAWAELAGAPPCRWVLGELAPRLRGRRVWAYSAAFDRRTLDLACRRHGLPPLGATWRCVLDAYERLRGFRPPLRTACEIEGIPIPAPLHRASTDALLTWALLTRLPEILEN